MIDDASRVLFVGAHCGDAEISAGAVLARTVRLGGQAFVLHLTAGEKGHPHIPPSDYRRAKIVEAEGAAQALGLSEMAVLEHGDAELPEAEDVVDEISDFVRLTKPNTVITHWAHSIHPDHEITHRLTQRAVFKAGIQWIESERDSHYAGGLLFAENWEDREGFVPHTYVDVSPDWDRWREAAECYALFRGEVVKFPYVSYYDHLSQVRGPESGVGRAVVFAVPRRALRSVVR
ncbi:MAG: PIG-L family deacetylase [Armatimonadia bacterium]|nr:PIG-L family deacetylase [Armatimonadia bacterium]